MGLVLHACWRQGQGLVMGVDSKNILKCVKHLVASIKIIWLVLLLDWFGFVIFCWNSFLAKDFHWDGSYLGCSRSHDSGQQQWLQVTPEHLQPTANPTLLFNPVPQAEPRGSGIWGMVLPCLSIPLTPSPCEGWREQLCFDSCEASALVTATLLSLLSGHTDCTSRALVRSLPCSGTAAVCAACEKTGISASEQWGTVGLNCPPAGHHLKCHLKVQAHKQNLYTQFVENVSISNIKHVLFVAKSGTSPSFNGNEFTKDQQKIEQRRMVGLIWLWALRWSQCSGRSWTQPDSEHGVHPTSSASDWGLAWMTSFTRSQGLS